MDVYVARQPIFDRAMKLFGYELLYRKSDHNYYEGVDDDEATMNLVTTSFFVFSFDQLTNQTWGFINFSANFLTSDMMYLLPEKQVVIEILERVEVNEAVIQACRLLKARGYMLALDDFIIDERIQTYLPLIELVDIIKIEYPAMNIPVTRTFIRRFRDQILFLAEKVETFEEYNLAKDMGFHLFQGFFFSRPELTSAKDIGSINATLIELLQTLQKKEVNFDDITSIIQRDVGLSFKLIKLSNFIQFGAKHHITSLRQALVHIGTTEIARWANLMLMKGIQRADNAELIKNSILRGKVLSLMAMDFDKSREYDYFTLGIFSSIDVLLGQPMQQALVGLPLHGEVVNALLGQQNVLYERLQAVIALEQGTWTQGHITIGEYQYKASDCMKYYLEAIKWEQSLSY